MRYYIKKVKDAQGEDTYKFYPAPVYSYEVTLDMIAAEVSLATSATAADVKAVLESFLAILPKYLIQGNRVNLEALGIFKVTFGGVWHDDAKDVSASDIRNPRISFLASADLKDAVLKNLSFSKEA